MRIFHIINTLCAALILVLGAACNNDTPSSGQPTPQPDDFQFENVRISDTGFALDILPSDKQMQYIVYVSEKSYFESNGITTERALLDDDYIYFQLLAEQYNLGVHDFLISGGLVMQGDKLTYKASGLNPATEYVVYCYGVSFEGDNYDVLTAINYTTVSTTSPEMIEASFDINSSIDGNNITLTINPNGYEGLYHSYIFAKNEQGYISPEAAVDEEYTALIRNKAYSEFNALAQDKAPEEFCMHGETTAQLRLLPNTDYAVVVFAVNDAEVPILCSVPTLHHFSTSEVAFSDFVVDIAVTDITPYTAEMTLTPSDKTTPYAAVLIKASGFDTFPEDELERMYYILEYIEPAIFNGTFSETLLPLMPSEEYVVVAFGCENRQPTSHLFVERFFAADASEGSITIDDIRIHKIFDTEQIATIDSSYSYLRDECECVVLAEAVTNKPCDKIYYWWYEGLMREEYEVEAYLEDLIMYGTTPSPYLFGLWYDFDFFFAGIAEDENGNMSEIFFGDTFTIKREDCSPAEEFFDYVNSSTSSKRAQCSAKSLVIR